MRRALRIGNHLPALTLAALACGLGWRNIAGALPAGTPIGDLLFPDPTNTAAMLAHYTMLPRIAIALLAGAALGLAGAILQRVLRNPLAEPATLGISAGSHVALAATSIIWPGVAIIAREWIALLGAGAALFTILALSWRRNLSPVTVILAGLIVSLYCGAAAAVLTLFNHDLLIGLFLWGAGYLDQQDWTGVRFLAPRLAFCFVVTGLLVRPLTLLTLEDDSARGLGISPVAIRLIALAVAGALTAFVTAAVGVISFVGLAAPVLSRSAGGRTTGRYLFGATLIGALLLAATDQIVQSLPTTYRLFPTGAVTAVLGAPLLLFMIPRLRSIAPPGQGTSGVRTRLKYPWATLAALTVLAAVIFWLCMALGEGPNGWEFATGEHLRNLLDWRLPRVVAAFSGGAMLALAGAILQRLTGNPLASPEVLGVS
jgi:ABC-type Fe3+-siderophore transport system permease subunit